MQDECLLEPELYERAEELFRGLLHYVTDFLVWEENSELPAELQPWYGPRTPSQILYMQNTQLNSDNDCLHPYSTKENAYYCVLYNDEHHSYEHVIYTLQRSVNCSEAEAKTHTALIDKEVFLLPVSSDLPLMSVMASSHYWTHHFLGMRCHDLTTVTCCAGSACSKDRNPSFLPASKRSDQGDHRPHLFHQLHVELEV